MAGGAEVEEVRRAMLARSAPAPATVSVRGTLRRAEETQALVLDADDGSSWELLLPAGWALAAERDVRVTVRGDVEGDAAFGAGGVPVLRVRSLSRGD